MMNKSILILISLLGCIACGYEKKTDTLTLEESSTNYTIPINELSGKWMFDTRCYHIEVDDSILLHNIEKEIINNRKIDFFPNTGILRFEPNNILLGVKGMNAEGSIWWNFEDTSDRLRMFGDYFTRNDTIYYYHWTLQNRYDYMVKKGERLFYHYDATTDFIKKHPNSNITKVIYYAEYVRMQG